MPSGLSTRQRFVKTPSEVRNVRVGFKDMLDTGELLTGTPTLSVSPAGLTTASPAVNGTTLTLDDESYVAGQAVTFVISSGTAGVVYEISITVSTDATQTFQRYVYVSVETAGSSTGEATVGGDYDVLRRRIGDYLGKSLDPDDWSQNDFDRIEDMIDAGYRQFLHPPPLANERVSWQWTFLRPMGSMVLWGTVSGTVTGVPTYTSSAGTSAIIATTAKFYDTMVGKTFTFDTSGNEYTVASYTSATAIKVTGDASGETSGDTFTVTADGDYQLSDDFGGMDGDIYFNSESDAWCALSVTGEGHIYGLRQREGSVGITRQTPEYAAIVPVNSTSSSEGQRFVLSVWPSLDAAGLHTIRYRYHALQNRLSLSRPFALGGAAHFQTLLQSCLAMAEAYGNDESGMHKLMFNERLAASVHFDRQAMTAKRIGTMHDPSMNTQQMPWRGRSIVTYMGTDFSQG